MNRVMRLAAMAVGAMTMPGAALAAIATPTPTPSPSPSPAPSNGQPAAIEGQLGNGYFSYQGPGTYSRNNGHERLTLTATPAPSISVSEYQDVAGGYAFGSGHINYFVLVSGPETDQPLSIPVSVAYALRGTTMSTDGATGDSRAALSLYGLNGNTFDLNVSESVTSGGYARSGTWSVSWLPNTYGNVDLSAFAGAFICSCDPNPGPSAAFAYVDPIFTIDPAFAQSHPGYSLSFSPGVGNSPLAGSVPEPASWALMIVGFGTVGGVVRRRTRRAAPAIA